MDQINTEHARIVGRLDKFSKLVEQMMIRRFHLVGARLQRKIQENISEPTRSLGPSKPGQYPHADTGLLRNSIFFRVDKKELSCIVGSPLAYAAYLEWGTGPIVPKTAKALHWIDPVTGRDVFARRTKGIQGRSYLRRTLIEEWPGIQKTLTMPLPGGTKVEAAIE